MFHTPIIKLYDYNNNKIFVKRDDLIPFSFGGNKVRKAVLFFEDILKKGCDSVITYGSSSSNHIRVVGNFCKKYNLECTAVTPESDDDSYNSSLARLLGVNYVKCNINEVSNFIESLIENHKAKGKKPYFISGGGHGNIGTQAYVDVFSEIQHYEKQEDTFFDYIFLASGTGTTQAGLICGKTIAQAKNTIIGISIARKNPHGKDVIYQSVKDYLIEKNIDSSKISNVILDDNYIAGGYGKSNDAIIEIIKEAFYWGLPLDATYTAKAFWGMKNYIINKNIEKKNILFINTGGTQLFFDALKVIAK